MEPYIDENIPSFRGESVVLGIDEAGRGPVLGPMVYGACYCVKEVEGTLRDMGIDDSKKISESDRERMDNLLRQHKDKIGWRIHGITPQEISAKMLRKQRSSLNDVSHETAISLIRTTQSSGVSIAEVYVDTVGNALTYQAKLSAIFPSIRITVAEKADAVYPIVGAASILAKVCRDSLLRNWKVSSQKGSCNYGHGYPGDPVTRKFLDDTYDPVFGFPDVVRFSWSTARDMIEAKGCEVNWYEDNEDYDVNQTKISSFFAIAQPKSKAKKGNDEIESKANERVSACPLRRPRICTKRQLEVVGSVS